MSRLRRAPVKAFDSVARPFNVISVDWREPFVGGELFKPRGMAEFHRSPGRTGSEQVAVDVQAVSEGAGSAWCRSTSSRRSPKYAFGPPGGPSPPLTAVTLSWEAGTGDAQKRSHDEPLVDVRLSPLEVHIRRCDGSTLCIAWTIGGRPWPQVQAFEVEILGYDFSHFSAIVDPNEKDSGMVEKASMGGPDTILGLLSAPLRRVILFSAPGDCREATIKGLQQRRTYKLRVRATDPEGPWSTTTSVRTGCGAAFTKPSRFWHNVNSLRSRKTL